MRRRRPLSKKLKRFLLRIRPRQKKLQGSFLHRLLGANLFAAHLWVPERKTVPKSAALGVFIGLLPLVGLQTVFSAIAAYFVKGNIPIAIVSTFISNPFTVGALILAQIKLGEKLAPSLAVSDPTQPLRVTQYFAHYGKPLLVGSLTSALVGGILAYPLGLWVWNLGEKSRLQKQQKNKTD